MNKLGESPSSHIFKNTSFYHHLNELKSWRFSYFQYKFILNSLVLFGLILTGCERDEEDLMRASFPSNPDVFIDEFSQGLNYAAFGGSDVKAFDVDNKTFYKGTTSMKIEVPDKDAPTGAYAGGVYFTSTGRDLSSYNALTFWAKASKSANIDIIGFGNDLGANKYQASISNVPVNSNWQKYYIIIPNPQLLTNERGMFFFSEAPESDRGYTFWIDEVKFENLGTLGANKFSIMGGQDIVRQLETGSTLQVYGEAKANLPTGIDQVVQCTNSYFSFTSSNPSVATVDANGLIKVMDKGTAVITASVNEVNAIGSVTIESSGAPVTPENSAPIPMVPADKVISVFSNAYTNVPVDFFNGYWQFSTTQLNDININGDDIKRYSQLNFVGIQFTSPTIDATSMNRFHIDVWTPDNISSSSELKLLLVDVGADLSFEGNDNSSHEITIPASQLTKESWISIDLPLSSFSGLASRKHLAQIVISGSLPNLFVDNIYFYNDGVVPIESPSTAAPTPSRSATDVISVFSDAYNNITGTDFNPNWGQATQVSQVNIQNNATLKYSGLNYQGVQLGSSQDVSNMQYLHIDYWTSTSSLLNVYLISPGPKETPYSLQVPSSTWQSIDIPLSAFTNVNLSEIIQLKFDGNGTIFLDNIYFYKNNVSNEPTGPASDPALPQADVISLFSEKYANVPVDTWRTDWSAANLESISISGNEVKKYTSLDFVGIETVMNQIDVSGMSYFSMDVWSPNADKFGIKIVDFGADGAFGGGDDVEHQIDFSSLSKGQWVHLDIPLTDFAGLITKQHIAQIILVGQPTGATTVYIDNVYFHK
ncbi:MAG: Ig-like domain-containing protein [Saprospiraceae bacterium]